MLTKTSESAIQTLVFLVLQDSREPISPRQIAQTLDLSPTYLPKVTNQLVKANILRAHRGSGGGVTLSRSPETITLLDVVEACQGQLVGDYCREVSNPEGVCAFHKAMLEVHAGLVEILGRWTIADFAAQPGPRVTGEKHRHQTLQCRMANVCSNGSKP